MGQPQRDPRSLATVLDVAHRRAASGLRGDAALFGGGFSGPTLLEPAGPARWLWPGPALSAAQVRDFIGALTPPDEGVLVYALSYEAATLLEAPDLYRDRPLDAASARFGPAAYAVTMRPVDLSEGHEAAIARRVLPLSTSTAARDAHCARVRACREALFAGVLYQANLAHPLTVPPRALGDGLRMLGSACKREVPAFAAHLDIPGWGSLASLSPECFVRYDLGAGRPWAKAFPIKGTIPRGATPEEDAIAIARLQRSTKDAAEHVMIVDLLRNDLGKVAADNAVIVTDLMRVVTVPNVHHLETEIRADLVAGTDLGALLSATLPGGSITGAPKSAAVEIIRDLEDAPRGLYTGILGTLDAEGRGEASILIRTWLRPDDGPGALHVGGGVVVGSDPHREWEETLAKARAFGDVEIEAPQKDAAA